MMHEQNENMNKERNYHHQQQQQKSQSLELKNTIIELKNSLKGFNSRFDQAEESTKRKLGHLKLSSQRSERKR